MNDLKDILSIKEPTKTTLHFSSDKHVTITLTGKDTELKQLSLPLRIKIRNHPHGHTPEASLLLTDWCLQNITEDLEENSTAAKTLQELLKYLPLQVTLSKTEGFQLYMQTIETIQTNTASSMEKAFQLKKAVFTKGLHDTSSDEKQLKIQTIQTAVLSRMLKYIPLFLENKS